MHHLPADGHDEAQMILGLHSKLLLRFSRIFLSNPLSSSAADPPRTAHALRELADLSG
jgi:hypothetical protein